MGSRNSALGKKADGRRQMSFTRAQYLLRLRSPTPWERLSDIYSSKMSPARILQVHNSEYHSGLHVKLLDYLANKRLRDSYST